MLTALLALKRPAFGVVQAAQLVSARRGFFGGKNRGTNLEIFKFCMYVFIPIGSFWYFNLPDFYETYVKELRRRVFMEDHELNRPPLGFEENHRAHQQLLEEGRRRRALRQAAEEQQKS